MDIGSNEMHKEIFHAKSPYFRLMESFLKIALPIYFLCYVTFLVVVRSLAVSRKIGKNPIVLSAGGNKFSRMNLFFKLLVALLAAYILTFTFTPALNTEYGIGNYFFMRMPLMDNNWLKIIGLALLLISFGIVFIAQIQMRNSWRIGIDHNSRTDLVSDGLFRYSRNPIYVGMLGTLLGLLLVTPNIFTLVLAVIVFILIQVQVRLEEQYLFKTHGQAFLDYKQKVRRFL
jgi:protein-S-isoprenylcysteine O-methyltransferase Ste14